MEEIKVLPEDNNGSHLIEVDKSKLIFKLLRLACKVHEIRGHLVIGSRLASALAWWFGYNPFLFYTKVEIE